ncbi:MAG: type II toxin-antitoxin system VapC family toxin [Candidatus Nealsonbacteria bacterium DGGOD1a]|jgi:Predicted nucleic acid-binding protein, contains PIN domain|nr:MAG: type II toxin-antitoxin system VapC family toxin [Candidatus Nealsonbacteria bacterium DGGOD1a]
MYTLDTNAIIYFLKGDKEATSVLEKIINENCGPIYISSITEAELFSYANLTDQDENDLEEMLTTLATITVDSRLARIAAWIRRQYGLKIADSIIAATAIFTGTTLVTRNIKDFDKIPNLRLLKI